MPPFKVLKDVVLDVEASDVNCLYYRYLLNRPTTRTLSKKVVYVTICDASIIRQDERSTESSLILKES